jgi:hypothetical protein
VVPPCSIDATGSINKAARTVGLYCFGPLDATRRGAGLVPTTWKPCWGGAREAGGAKPFGIWGRAPIGPYAVSGPQRSVRRARRQACSDQACSVAVFGSGHGKEPPPRRGDGQWRRRFARASTPPW